jgi:hypothetical protein
MVLFVPPDELRIMALDFLYGICIDTHEIELLRALRYFLGPFLLLGIVQNQ